MNVNTIFNTEFIEQVNKIIIIMGAFGVHNIMLFNMRSIKI
jgi:hypothetical protein